MSHKTTVNYFSNQKIAPGDTFEDDLQDEMTPLYTPLRQSNPQPGFPKKLRVSPLNEKRRSMDNPAVSPSSGFAPRGLVP